MDKTFQSRGWEAKQHRRPASRIKRVALVARVTSRRVKRTPAPSRDTVLGLGLEHEKASALDPRLYPLYP